MFIYSTPPPLPKCLNMKISYFIYLINGLENVHNQCIMHGLSFFYAKDNQIPHTYIYNIHNIDALSTSRWRNIYESFNT